MSERLFGIEEADRNGYIKGLQSAQNLLKHESKHKNHTINFFAQAVGELLQEMIIKALPPEQRPKKEEFNYE